VGGVQQLVLPLVFGAHIFFTHEGVCPRAQISAMGRVRLVR
jgi:hypothetical protein